MCSRASGGSTGWSCRTGTPRGARPPPPWPRWTSRCQARTGPGDLSSPGPWRAARCPVPSSTTRCSGCSGWPGGWERWHRRPAGRTRQARPAERRRLPCRTAPGPPGRSAGCCAGPRPPRSCCCATPAGSSRSPRAWPAPATLPIRPGGRLARSPWSGPMRSAPRSRAVAARPPCPLRDPATGEPGLRLEFRAGDGTLLDSEHRSAAMFAWWDGTPPGVGWGESGSITLLADYLPAGTATHLLGASGVGRLSLSVDGRVIADEATGVPDDPVQAMTRPGEVRARARLRAGVAARLELQFRPAAGGAGPLGLRLGVAQERSDDELLAEAERAASGADAAVVVVGSAELTESEGFDRQTLALPGRQDEIVRRVSAVNKATIVVVNSGAPVLMPWAGEVAAIVYAWLPGQEFGEALADVLLGFREPGGRLPVTMPACEGDCPVLHATPEAGALRYREGLLIGYRGYDAAGTEPLFPFGHGLGYTTWAYEALDVPARTLAAGDDLDLTVTVRNTGAGPGARASVSLRIPARGFARWDEQAGGWAWPRGRFTVRVGRSSRDLRLSAPVDLG